MSCIIDISLANSIMPSDLYDCKSQIDMHEWFYVFLKRGDSQTFSKNVGLTKIVQRSRCRRDHINVRIRQCEIRWSILLHGSDRSHIKVHIKLNIFQMLWSLAHAQSGTNGSFQHNMCEATRSL